MTSLHGMCFNEALMIESLLGASYQLAKDVIRCSLIIISSLGSVTFVMSGGRAVTYVQEEWRLEETSLQTPTTSARVDFANRCSETIYTIYCDHRNIHFATAGVFH